MTDANQTDQTKTCREARCISIGVGLTRAERHLFTSAHKGRKEQKMDTELNEKKAHYQEGSNADGSRKFTVFTPSVTCVFTSKADAKQFKELYDAATKALHNVADAIEALEVKVGIDGSPEGPRMKGVEKMTLPYGHTWAYSGQDTGEITVDVFRCTRCGRGYQLPSDTPEDEYPSWDAWLPPGAEMWDDDTPIPDCDDEDD